jgi:hypothetical protein
MAMPITLIAIVHVTVLVPVDRCIVSLEPGLLMILRGCSGRADGRKCEHRG